ncbi:hypothetical protein ACRAWD_00920 [Caulobacter segnis]
MRIWTNTAERTIASGEAFARGLTPGCGTRVGHRPQSEVDPLFELLARGRRPVRSGRPPSPRSRPIRGRRPAGRPSPAGAGRAGQGAGLRSGQGLLAAARFRRHPRRRMAEAVDLTGPIRDASGTAQVLLLQYAEGLSPTSASWRGVGPAP